ncbi:MAG: homoserine kinase [Mariprofundaceae bacterium]
MSVYTELNQVTIEDILQSYQLGNLHSFTGIAAGIENSNFFIHCDAGRFVLTLFERMNAAELPYFMHLMHHLAAHGLQSPAVQCQHDGAMLFEHAGKKGCIVSALHGETLLSLNNEQLFASGEALAQLHLAGNSFNMERQNPNNINWLREQVKAILEDVGKQYGEESAWLLQDELSFQQALHWHTLPRGVIHADLFCDNILFDGNQVSGIIDFYYAHDSAYVLDIAIAINAQAIIFSPDDDIRIQSLIKGYEHIRTLQADERQALPALIRLAALRFWISRLYDALYPRDGAMTQVKDPEEYHQKLLRSRTCESVY